MPKVDILTLDGQKAETIDLPAVFAVTPKKPLLHQAVVAYLANQRQATAHTKTRGEVRGGGRKPWRQKGTGRARAGSSRSPIWIGGGITFGPLNAQNFTKRFPDKMKRLAIRMALSVKANEGKVAVVDSLTLKQAKTKEAAQAIAKLAPEATSVLIVTAAADATLLQATRNLPTAAVMTVSDLNTYDILNFDQLLFTKDALAATATQFGNAK